MPKEVVYACFGPVMFAERFIIGEYVNALTVCLSEPLSILVRC